MKNLKKWIALGCCLTLTASSLSGCGTAASEANAAEISSDEIAEIEQSLEELDGLDELVSHSDTAGKTETVYAILDANGHREETIGSNWLKNADGSTSLSDVSDLSDLTVVKGTAEYTKTEQNRILWSNDGSDIYYQGTSDKELPVDVQIAYELDGNTVSAEELSGASGHLKMIFSYVNHTAKETTIHGEKRVIYQPFVMISGMLLDNSKAKNIVVDNGSTVNSGDHTIVFGIAMPGLKESLGLADLTDDDGEAIDIDIPETVCVEADVTDFSLTMTLSVASNTALNELGLDDIDTIDDLKADMDKLTDGMNEIIDGATQLHDGSKELTDGTNELSDGANTLANGTGELADGAKELKDGAKELKDGAADLKDGMDTLKGKAPALVKGVGDLADGTKKLDAGMSQITAKNDDLNNGSANLADSLAALNAALNSGTSAARLDTIAADSASVSDQLSAITAEYDYEEGSYAGLLDELTQYAEGLADSDDEAAATSAASILALIDAYKALYQDVAATQSDAAALTTAYEGIDTQAADPTLAATIGALSAGADTLKAGIAGYTAGVSDAAASITKLNAGANALNTQVPTLVSGINKLSDGASDLADGSKTLASGASDLSDGAKELNDGTGDLKKGVASLLSGVNEFADGTLDLKDGVIKFNEEGIQKLADIVNNDLEKYYDNLKAVQDYAKEYTTYSGCEEDIECSVKFIYKTGSIE